MIVIRIDYDNPCVDVCTYPYEFDVAIAIVIAIVREQQIYGPEAERNFYESQIIVLDTLEQCLNAVRHSCFLLDGFLSVSNV